MENQPRYNKNPKKFPLQLLGLLDKRVSVHSVMDIEINNIPMHVVADGNTAVISFKRIADISAILRILKKHYGFNRETLSSLKAITHKMGLTIYLNNKLLGIAGPKAGFIFPGIIKLLTR